MKFFLVIFIYHLQNEINLEVKLDFSLTWPIQAFDQAVPEKYLSIFNNKTKNTRVMLKLGRA